MFDKLEKHHLGFIIPVEERKMIEEKFDKQFHYDAIQETHVLFAYDKNLRTYIEYICQEGRVAKQKPGFAHVCYSVKDKSTLEGLENVINTKKMGYRLTNLEKSGSAECGRIVFYFIKDIGVVELNVQE